MHTEQFAASLQSLFSELVNGPAPGEPAYILNTGDAGLLRSLDRISSTDASRGIDGGATIAAHVNHVCYGIWLMNEWAAGRNRWEQADWSKAWEMREVSDREWRTLRASFRDEVHRWQEQIGNPRNVDRVELHAMIASVVHLAYHLGAIRQIDKDARGPREPGATGTSSRA